MVQMGKVIGGLVVSSLLHAGITAGFYALLSDAPVASPLDYVLKMVIAPIFLMQWFMFEIKAVSRMATKDAPFGPQKEGVSQKLDRVQINSFEQAVMTTAVCIAMSQTDLAGFNLKLAPAWAYTYLLCRPLFALGYVGTPDGSGRLPGLLAGGFWSNCAALLYCCLVLWGCPASVGLMIGIYVAVPAVMLVYVIYALSKPKAAEEGKEEPASTYGAVQ